MRRWCLGSILNDPLYRQRRVVNSPQGVEIKVDGVDYLSFNSNDYLGLANHPSVASAFISGVNKWGAGSGSAHLVSGHSEAHHALEEELAEFVGYPSALLFSSGYMANLAIQQALLGRGDRVVQDRLNHASLLDGTKLAGAKLLRYQHCDVEALKRRISVEQDGKTLVATDGVFSMDGDIAPLTAISQLCNNLKSTMLLVDDAHGIGVLGSGGRGTVDSFGFGVQEVPILMGTLGKAFGVAGAFVAGSDDLIESLIQQARTYIYTTATPSAQAEALRKSLQLLQGECGEERRERLHQLISRFRIGAENLALNLLPSTTPIQPLLVGSAESALAFSACLREQGIMVAAIRPPTVPQGESRLRITISANHTNDHIDQLLEALSLCVKMNG